MKKTIYLLMITTSVAACKKKKSENTPPAQNASPTQNTALALNQNCRTSKIEVIGKETATLTFNYDDKENVAKIVNIAENETVTYTYSKNNIVSQTSAIIEGDNVQITTYSLDDSGKITYEERGYREVGRAESVTTENITYKYTDDGYLSVATKKNMNKSQATAYAYTWQNGNITSLEKTSLDKNNTTINKETIFFQYGAEAFPINFMADNNRDENEPCYLTKYFGKMPKNLPSRATNRESVEEYAYQKDDKGNIVKVTKIFKRPKERDQSSSVMYYYNCK